MKASEDIPLLDRSMCTSQNHIQCSIKKPKPFDINSLSELLQQANTRGQTHEDLTDAEWYYWQPIHFAAQSANLDMLKLVLEGVSDTKQVVNALTVFSENALHVLLEYSRRSTSVDLQFLFGDDIKVCKVVDVENQDLEKCVRYLINKGIDINYNNIWNETPLAVAIKYKLLKVAQLLLLQEKIDVSLCTGKPLRDFIDEYGLTICEKNKPDQLSPLKTLFTLLKSRQEYQFLRYNNENIESFANRTENEDIVENGNQIQNHKFQMMAEGYFTMLHLCLLKGYLDCIDYDTQSHASDNLVPFTKAPILEAFCRLGFPKCILYLLENRADIFLITNKKKFFSASNVFDISVQLNYFPFLAMILEHPNFFIIGDTYSRLFQALVIFSNTALDKSKANCRYVVLLLMTKLEELKLRSDHLEKEVIETFTKIMDKFWKHRNNNTNQEIILQTLRLGACLVKIENFKAEHQYLKYMDFDALKTHLDQCIDKNNVYYDSIVQQDEIEALHILKHDSKKAELLNHPVMILLLNEKWKLCRNFFYCNVIFHVLFLLVLYLYMILVQINVMWQSIEALFLVFFIIQTAKEMVQVYILRTKYFKDPANYVELIGLFCCTVNIIEKNSVCMVIAIMFYSSVFLLMLGQLPGLAKYMIFFSSTKYFLEYSCIYLIQLLSFALCFYILLTPPNIGKAKEEHVSEALANITVKFFDTMFYFIGQFDAQVITVQHYPVFGRIIVAIFAVCMTVILNNFLVGLIVTDMETLQKNGKLQRQIKMIRFISKLRLFLNILPYDPLKWSIGIKLFQENARKVLDISKSIDDKFFLGFKANVFAEEDLQYLQKIRKTYVPRVNPAKTVCEFIVSETKQNHNGAKRSNEDWIVLLREIEKKFR